MDDNVSVGSSVVEGPLVRLDREVAGPTGDAIVALAQQHLGETYDFGATAKYADPAYAGPWDCAEFASWCAYRTYGLLYAVRPADPNLGQSYSGWWYDDARRLGHAVPVDQAIATRGAILVRKPRPNGAPRIGHVAISLGDGRTVEAMDTAHGVTNGRTANRIWDAGVLLPGVTYSAAAPLAAHVQPPWLGPDTDADPATRLVQARLVELGFSPGPVDGVYGDLTAMAVAAFQASRGLRVDGLVGPQTLAALHLADQIQLQPSQPRESGPEPRPGNADPTPARREELAAAIVFTFSEEGGRIYATADGGPRFLVGRGTTYTDDMTRAGLFQPGGALDQIARSGVYDRRAEAERLGAWAHFLWPTILGESNGYYGRVNSYDRAAFTWGCFQFAAHTPQDNLVLLFRELLELPDAGRYFPDLALRQNAGGQRTVHRVAADGEAVDLEVAENVTRPNGKVELQIPRFMAYLNPDPTRVGPEEMRAAAALMEWAAASSATRAAQVDLALSTMQRKLRSAASTLPELRNHPWAAWLWVGDIRHQGRATYGRIRDALAAADPLEALSQLGSAVYSSRKATVKAAIATLEAEGAMAGWEPP